MSFSCLDPYAAVSYFTQENGKKYLKLFSKTRLNYNLDELKRTFGSDNVFLLSCGKCESCRRNAAEQWAIRCVCESMSHPYNYFLTLTFDSRHIDYASKSDLDKFLDRLEGVNHKRKFKYFACMERGTISARYHFHLALFCDFPLDLYDGTKIKGVYYYHSKLLDKLWNFGLYNVAPFVSSCARYIAKYATKDNGAKLFMSRNLGKQYFLDHHDEIIKNDFKIYGDFGHSKSSDIPKAFVRWFVDEGVSQVEKYNSYRKEIGKLVNQYRLRNHVSIHDETLFHEARHHVKSNKERRMI